jgi:hypothetical protein
MADKPAPRVRRRSTTVEKIELPTALDWRATGELIAPLDEEHELSDVRSALLTGSTLPGESQVAPLFVDHGASRKRSQIERILRLLFAVGILLTIVAFFAKGGEQSIRRIVTGESTPRWRQIPLVVTASVDKASVYIDGKLRGKTPLLASERCRGRTIRVRIEAAGHSVWQWSGFCPASGDLKLNAALVKK